MRSVMERSYITLAHAQAAMNAMLEAAQKRPEQPVAIAIVDDAGLMVAYNQMDNLTVFARRHYRPQGVHVGDHGA